MPFFGIDYIDLDPLRSENGPFSKIDRDLACPGAHNLRSL